MDSVVIPVVSFAFSELDDFGNGLTVLLVEDMDFLEPFDAVFTGRGPLLEFWTGFTVDFG
jgi:hypothetical protein